MNQLLTKQLTLAIAEMISLSPKYPPGILDSFCTPVNWGTDFVIQQPLSDGGFTVHDEYIIMQLAEEAEKERVRIIDSKIEAVKYCMKMETLSNHAWEFNKHGSYCQGHGGCNIQHGMLVGGQRSWNWCQYRHEYTILTWDSSDMGAIGCESPYIYDYYCAPIRSEVELTLDLAEEDWEYEKWLEEIYQEDSIMNQNMVQSYKPESRCVWNATDSHGDSWTDKTGWCGNIMEKVEISADDMVCEWKKSSNQDPSVIKHIHRGQIGHILLKDRYKIEAEVMGGPYAKGPYGLIYIPPKMQRFLPPIGESATLTISKNSGDKLKCKAKFTALYNH